MDNSCVILGDKHQSALEGIRGLLESVFSGVVMVADQPSLFEAIDKIAPEYVIVDMSLLALDQQQSSFKLNKRFYGTKCIILAVNDDPSLVEYVIKAGARAFVLKQYAATDLFEAIEVVEKGGVYISPAILNADI
jgi:DNA-binding NarL/FixJ family response regulator